jgi:hypothetical protein
MFTFTNTTGLPTERRGWRRRRMARAMPIGGSRGSIYIDAQTGAMREIYTPKWQMEDPHVSPDGKNVAIIEGLMSDEGITGAISSWFQLSGPSDGGAGAECHSKP